MNGSQDLVGNVGTIPAIHEQMSGMGRQNQLRTAATLNTSDSMPMPMNAQSTRMCHTPSVFSPIVPCLSLESHRILLQHDVARKSWLE
jgi:hypothetical protein